MKKTVKAIIVTLIVAVLAAAGCFAAAASEPLASGAPFRIGDTEYADIAAALNAAKAGDTIVMIADYDHGDRGGVAVKKDVTLDLNGHSFKVGYSFITNNGENKRDYNIFNISSNFNIVGSGRFLTCRGINIIGANSTVTVIGDRAGITFEAIDGLYPNDGDNIVANETRAGFTGGQVFKVGSTGSPATLNIRGFVNFVDSSYSTSIDSASKITHIGVYSGSVLNIDNARVSATLGEVGADGKDAVTVAFSILQPNAGSKAGTAMNITDSYVECSNGNFSKTLYGTGAFSNTTTWNYRTAVNVSGSSIRHTSASNMFENGRAHVEFKMTDSEVYSVGTVFSAYDFNIDAYKTDGAIDPNKCIPFQTAILKNCDFTLAGNYLTTHSISLRAEGGRYVSTGKSAIFYGNTVSFTPYTEGAANLYGKFAQYMEDFGGFGAIFMEGCELDTRFKSTPVGYLSALKTTNNNFSIPDGTVARLKINDKHELVNVLVKSAKPAYNMSVIKNETIQNVGVGVYDATANQGISICSESVFKGRNGIVTVKEAANGNRYFVYKQSEKHGTGNAGGSYFDMLYASKPTTGGARSTSPIADVDYYAYDFDVMTPNGSFDTTVSFDFMKYMINDKGALDFAAIPAICMSMGSDASGTYFKLSKTETRAYISAKPGEWTHVSFVLSVDNSENPDNSVNVDRSCAFVYVNGERVIAASNVLSGMNFEDPSKYCGATYENGAYTYDKGCAAISLLRINFAKKYGSANETAFDNMSFRRYMKGETRATLDEVLSDGYCADSYDMPYESDLITVDGVTYDDQVKAQDALVYGSSVVLHADLAAPFLTDLPCKVDTAGYRFEYASDKLCADISGNVYTLREADETEYYTVTYTDTDGKVLLTETLPAHSKPAYVSGLTRTDGWVLYKADGNWIANGEIVTELTSDLTVTPAFTAYPYLSAAKYNIVTMGHFQLNLYIPTTLPESVTLGAVTKDGAALSASAVLISGEKYSMYSVWPQAVGCALKQIFNISYTVVQGDVIGDNGKLGTAKTVNQVFRISVLDYAITILEGDYTAEEKTMMADLIRYSGAINDATIPAGSYYEYNEALLKYGSYCSELIDESEIVPSEEVDYSAISGYVSSISFSVNSYQPYYVFRMSGKRVKSVAFTYDGFYGYGTDEDEYNWLAGQSATVYSSTATDAETGLVYLTSANTGNVRIYNLDRPMKITMEIYDVDENGGLLETTTTVSAIYDAATYYHGMSGTAEAQALYKHAVRALISYGDSVQAYRFPAGKVEKQ